MPALVIETPAGPLLLVERDGALAEARFAAPGRNTGDEPGRHTGDESDLLHRAKIQAEEYFSGKRRHFDLPLAAAATPFQDRVRRAMLAIPHGQTRS